ncbi:MAG: S8 family serine peptidase, partial [Phycisphaerales bacterium JB039]
MRRMGAALGVCVFSVTGVGQADEAMWPVLVQFASAPTAADLAALEAQGARVTRVFGLVPGACAEIPAGLDLMMVDNPRIVAVEADVPGTYLDEYTEAWSIGHIGSEPTHRSGQRGAGVKLGILDSGIHGKHPDLEANYVFGYDFEAMSSTVRDSINHGTHVSGTAAAVGNGFGVIGVAPEAGIHMLKVGSFAPTAGAAIAALEWAVGNGIQVTNSSFELPDTALLQMAYDAAWEA